MAFLSAQGHLVDAEGDCSAVLQHLHTSVRGCQGQRQVSAAGVCSPNKMWTLPDGWNFLFIYASSSD